MGMYDSIYCFKKLPLNKELQSLKIKWSKVEFQTKNLENYLGYFEITKNGHLVELVKEYEYIPFSEEEKKDKNYKPWNIYKDVKEISVKRKKINYHGIINFYSCEEFNEQEDIWIEFDAYFIYGKLDKIELKKSDKIKSRSISAKEWIKNYENDQKKIWSKIKRILNKFGWRYIWRKFSNSLSTINNFLSKIQILILKYAI